MYIFDYFNYAGDPMAEYFNSIRDKAEQEVAVRTGKPPKPRYRGPAPAPNRFGIAPGYRWDAIDRYVDPSHRHVRDCCLVPLP